MYVIKIDDSYVLSVHVGTPPLVRSCKTLENAKTFIKGTMTSSLLTMVKRHMPTRNVRLVELVEFEVVDEAW